MHATRRVTFPTFLFALSTLTGAPGCDAPEEDEDLGAIEVRPYGCHWCTSTIGNAPNLNGADLSDINLDLQNGGSNTTGIKLRPGKTADGMTFQLTVDPSTERFVGVDVHNPALTCPARPSSAPSSCLRCRTAGPSRVEAPATTPRASRPGPRTASR